MVPEHRQAVELLLQESDPSILKANVERMLANLDQGVDIHFLAQDPTYALEFQALNQILYGQDFAVEFQGVHYVGHVNRYCVTFLAEAEELVEPWEEFCEYAKEVLILDWEHLETPQAGVLVAPFYGASRRILLDGARLLKVAGFEAMADAMASGGSEAPLSLEDFIAGQLASTMLCGVPPSEVVTFEEIGRQVELVEFWTEGPKAQDQAQLIEVFNNVLARLNVAHEQLTF